MTEREFVKAFENGEIAKSDFHHRDHVRLAWACLREHTPLAAIERFTSSLRRFAAAAGKPGLYHETISWAYLFLIQERIARAPEHDWEAFVGENPDLFAWNPSLLDSLYTPETLASDLARRVFLLPDRIL